MVVDDLVPLDEGARLGASCCAQGRYRPRGWADGGPTSTEMVKSSLRPPLLSTYQRFG